MDCSIPVVPSVLHSSGSQWEQRERMSTFQYSSAHSGARSGRLVDFPIICLTKKNSAQNPYEKQGTTTLETRRILTGHNCPSAGHLEVGIPRRYPQRSRSVSRASKPSENHDCQYQNDNECDHPVDQRGAPGHF